MLRAGHGNKRHQHGQEQNYQSDQEEPPRVTTQETLSLLLFFHSKPFPVSDAQANFLPASILIRREAVKWE
jgi:hypothetical protein